MTIQQLRYFLALCEDLNYTHTAQRLYLSRQALRTSISTLEKELCGALFQNVRNHLSLTERGDRFRAQAAPVVAQFDAMCQQAYQDIRSAPIHLGISVALVPDYLPPLGGILDEFRRTYPGIPLETEQLPNDTVTQRLLDGSLNAGLVMDLGQTAPALDRTALTWTPAALMVSRSSPFWAQQSISPAELDGQRLLVPGLAPDALAPLWNALHAAGATPQIEVGERYYQVRYQVQEENCVSLNGLFDTIVSETDPVRDIALEGMPALSAAFLTRKGTQDPCIQLLCDTLRQALAHPPAAAAPPPGFLP